MNPTRAPKPANGFLMYGNNLIEKDKPFKILSAKQKQLQANGFKKSAFHKHYYFSETQLINYLNSLKNEVPKN